MNFNVTLTCDTCEKDTDCRVGMSNRDVQPLSYACPHCRALINLTHRMGSGFEYSGAQLHANRQYGLFDNRNPFMDLHLDFPVWINKYVPGMTPFMVAMQKIEEDAEGGNDAMALFQLHNQRLNQLNYFHDKSDEIRTILKLYAGADKKLFKSQVAKFLKKDLESSLKPEDVNAALYQFVSFVFLPLVHHGIVKDVVNKFSLFMRGLSGGRAQAFNAFIDHLQETGFLHAIQRDCLKLYPHIYDAELPLRPALFLDLVKNNEKNKIAARISTRDFTAFKDLYKDIAEVFGRQLILVAGLNNIMHRDGHNIFSKPTEGNALSSLAKFADKTLSEKFKYLDDCWYAIDRTMVDTGVRNSIAHFTTEYDEVSQVITYFPEREGIRQERGETMFFLDFMRMLLQLFREMHYLHHVIKGLFYYEYLIRGKERN